MPNGGTDNCMNCRHNTANQSSVSIKTAPRVTRIPFCSVHQIPVWDHAWTYCENIISEDPDINIPINTVGLSSEGYSRIPWLGRTAPSCGQDVPVCKICGTSVDEGIRLKSDALDLDAGFCCNEHYREWQRGQLKANGFGNVYGIGRNKLHQAVLSRDFVSLKAQSEVVLFSCTDFRPC